MALTEQQKQKLRTQYASASDYTLHNIFHTCRSDHPADVVAIVEEIWTERKQEREKEREKIRARYDSEGDGFLLAMLENRSSHPSDVIAVVSAILRSRSHKLPESKDTETASYLLTELCARWYCLTFEIGLWLLLIGGTIAGAVIGHSFAGETGVFFGLVIGFAISFVFTLSAGGLISVFLKLCADVADIKSKLKN